MAEEVVLSGVQKLYDLLNREYARLQGVGAQVYALTHQLEMLQSLLKDADTKKHESDRVRNFLEEVKDGVYDAEDIIESFLLNEIGGEERGIIKKLMNLLASCFLLHKLALDIEDVTKRISMVIGDMQSLGTQRVMDGGPSLSFQDRQRKQKEIQQTFPNSPDNGSDLVGVEESVVELVGHLVKNDIIQVVSISGMGGIGKTTLARQVFHHDLVRRHFDGFAWVCVSQQFTQKHVWQKILQQLQPHNGEILQMDVHALQSKLHQLLGTAKYLVFLDDVWTGEDWDRIKAVFPQKKGWKMLLTSRNEGVRLHVDRTCLGFRARILKTEESWKLFEMVVSSKRYDTELPLFDKEMEVMGKEMVAYCGGLPLAVIQLGVLLTKKHTAREWKRVYENIGFEISQTSVYKVLSLSYEDLPMHLKSCFLCLAHFPKDYKIEISTLFNYWAAEGIYNRSTIHDRGEDYLEELVRRNLVIVNENYWKSRFESCQMHDMMREVCLSKAKEDNFLQVIQVPNSTCTINAHSPCRSRRLTIHSGNAFDILVQEKRKVRSLFVLRLKEVIWIHQASSFQSLPMLRVLDLSLVIFEGETLPNSIGRLIYLRFLSLDQATVLHIPSTLGNLKLLLYLNLNVNARLPVYVPNVFKEMIELRYLALPRLMVDKTKLEFGDLVNMEYLSSFSTQHSNVRDLLCMTKLRSLTVSFSERCTFATLSRVLRDLKNLTTLEFNLMIKSIKVDYVEEFVLDCMYLKELGLAVRMSKIPDQHQFPPNLGHIYLSFCHMEEDPMPILEKFRHLKSVDLRGEVFVGRKMVCSKGGFPQLCALKISKESELEEWIVEEGSMPCLLTLTIHDCKKLKELPKGLKYIISLKEVKIEGMKEWKEKLILGGKDYYKVQHIPSVLLINCDDE